MKKILALMLVMMMVLSTMTVAFAETTETIENVDETTSEPSEEPATEDAVEEPAAEEPVEVVDYTYVTLSLDSEITFVLLDGVVVDYIENTEEPVEEPATEEPAEEPATEEPAEEPVTEEPVEEPATEEPVEEPATEEPAEEPATEEPVEEPVTEEPVEEPSIYIGMSLTEAISDVTADYESEEKIQVVIIASEENGETIEDLLEENFDDLIDADLVKEDSENPNAERFIMAEKYQITNGKANLLEKLQAGMPEDEMDYELWANASVKDIMKAVKENRKASLENEEILEEIEAEEEVEEEVQVEKKVKSEKKSSSSSNKGKAKGKK